MKKRFMIFLMPLLMICGSMTMQAQTSEPENDVIDNVAETLNENLDSTTYLEYQLKIQSLEESVNEMKSTYAEFKENKVDSVDDFKGLYSIIMAFLTSILTFLQRQGWLKNIKQGIVVVVGTALALVLALTAFKGDWNAWSFVTNWFVASGGGVLAWELVLKYILKREK